MAITGTFNGASIVTFPTCPGIKSLQMHKNDTVALSRSPFVGTTQVQAWPGADWWEADVALPQMEQADKSVWSAFFGECRGMANVFYMGDPLHSKPCGNPQGTPLVNGVNVPMAITLNTKGWKPNTSRLLLPGDYLQLGVRLHEVLEVVNSDANGNAPIVLYPSIREVTADGDSIVLDNPQGLWRLAENRRSILSDETLLSGLSFKAMEAR